MPFSRESAALHQLEHQLRDAVDILRFFAKQKREEADSVKPSVYEYSTKDFQYGWNAGVAHACTEAADSVQRILADVEKFHERVSA